MTEENGGIDGVSQRCTGLQRKQPPQDTNGHKERTQIEIGGISERERGQRALMLLILEIEILQPESAGGRPASSRTPTYRNGEPLVWSPPVSCARKASPFFLADPQSGRVSDRVVDLKPETFRSPKKWILKTVQGLPFYSTREGRYIMFKTADSINDSPLVLLPHTLYSFLFLGQ